MDQLIYLFVCQNVAFVIYDRPVLNAFLGELRDGDNSDDEGLEKMAMGTLRQYAKASKAGKKTTTLY